MLVSTEERKQAQESALADAEGAARQRAQAAAAAAQAAADEAAAAKKAREDAAAASKLDPAEEER